VVKVAKRGVGLGGVKAGPIGEFCAVASVGQVAQCGGQPVAFGAQCVALNAQSVVECTDSAILGNLPANLGQPIIEQGLQVGGVAVCGLGCGWHGFGAIVGHGCVLVCGGDSMLPARKRRQQT
jgi:hypothetical protein